MNQEKSIEQVAWTMRTYRHIKNHSLNPFKRLGARWAYEALSWAFSDKIGLCTHCDQDYVIIDGQGGREFCSKCWNEHILGEKPLQSSEKGSD